MEQGSNLFKQLLGGLMLLTLVGCSSNHSQYVPVVDATRPQAERIATPAAQQQIRSALLEQYEDWKGTRYQYGGMSRSGVDCSGFVYLTYQNKLGQSVPRTTLQQARVGVPVSRHALQVGDLVFFKTGDKDRHVGIFLGDSRFLHASTSKGVTISNLNNRYWASNYWMAKRVASR